MTERKRSSQSNGARSDLRPLLASDDGNSVNIGIGADIDFDGDVEIKGVSRSPSTDQPAASFSFRALPAQKKLTFSLLAFANFAACTCFSLLAPFFPAEASKKGVSQTVIGLIFSTFELWIFISAPIYGNFMTRIGSQFMFKSGLFVCGTCAILFGVLDRCPPGNIFIVLCFVVRSVEALGASAFITASFAIIANEFPDHASTAFGILETFTGLGMMVGPPVGGALYELGGYGVPFWVMGSLLVGCASLTILLLPSRPDNPRPDQGSIWTLLSAPLVLVTVLTIVSGSYALGFLDPTLAKHLNQFHLRTVFVGLVFIVPSTVYAITAPMWGYLSDAKGIFFPCIVIGSIVSVGAFLLLGPSPLLSFIKTELWLIIVSLALFGLSVGCTLVNTLRCLLIGAKQIGFEDNLDTFGLVSGLFNSAFSLGTFIGPSVGSAVQDYYGFGWAATVTAAVFAFSAFTFTSYLILSNSCSAVSSCCQQEDSISRGLLNRGSRNRTYNTIGSASDEPYRINGSLAEQDNC